MKKRMLDNYNRAQERAAYIEPEWGQGTFLAQFVESPLWSQFVEDSKVEGARQDEVKAIIRWYNSCDRMSGELRVPIEDLRSAAVSRLVALQLTTAEVDRAKAILKSDEPPEIPRRNGN